MNLFSEILINLALSLSGTIDKIPTLQQLNPPAIAASAPASSASSASQKDSK